MSNKSVELVRPLRLSSDARLVLHASSTESGSFQISLVGSEDNPTFSNTELLRLAIEVLRNEATERLVPFTAVRQLRFRSTEALKRKLKTRLRQIEAHFGHVLPSEERQNLLLRRQLQIGERLQLEQVDERWRLVDRRVESSVKPQCEWRELVTLSVLILRDMWTEIFYHSFYLPMLRTPDEIEVFEDCVDVAPEEVLAPLTVRAPEQDVSQVDCVTLQAQLEQQRTELMSERSELDTLLEEVIRREQLVEVRENNLNRQRAALNAREQHIRSLEEQAVAGKTAPGSKTQSSTQQQAHRKKRRGRRRRGSQ